MCNEIGHCAAVKRGEMCPKEQPAPAERPTFMRDDLPTSMPALGELAVGDTVWVSEPSYRGRKSPDVLATVTAKARVWVTVARQDRDSGWPKEWRLRLDTQTDYPPKQQSNYATHFRTPEQQLWHWATKEARVYLNAQKIHTEIGSPWNTETATIRLARIIWEAEERSNVDA
jgi:hypothetical protein